MITPEEKFAEALFDHYPKTRGRMAIKFPVFTGRSGSSVWQVEISEQNNHPGGAAYAKVDALIRCQKERDRHTLAKDHPHMRQYIPEIIFPRANSQTIQVDGQTFVIYQPALGMIRTLSLSDVLRDRRYTMRDEAEVIKHLIDPVLASWYQAAHTTSMQSFDLAAEFTRLFDLGEEDLDPTARRSAGLAGRLKNDFGLEDTIQRLIFDRPDATVSLPNPAYFLPRLSDLLTERQRSISLPALPMHGDLHTGNIICALGMRGQLNIDTPPALIDFAQYEEEGFPFFDLAYLELSILVDSLPAETMAEWESWHALLTLITQSVLPEGQPEGREAETVWTLLTPLRAYVESLLKAAESRGAGVRERFETAWWFAAAVAGLRFARRSATPGGQRSAALFYAGAAVKHLLKEVLPLDYTDTSYIIMNWADHVGFRADGVSLPAPRDPIRRSSLPQPPQIFVAHTYTLPQFIGRADELTLLKNWAASSDPIMVVEAIGGQGKSALTWHWLHNHASKDIPRFAGAMWWSFYESDGAMDNFIANALAYVTDTPLREVKQFAREERERMLLAALKQRPFLLVMDGLERILKAYYTTKAAHLTDDEIEAMNRRGEKNDRACINPLDGRFLEALLKVAPSKILISTRLLPLSLEARFGGTLPGVQHKRLDGLSDNDALDLIRHYGIKGSSQQIRDFTHQFGNHGLILGVIAGQINDYRPAPRDFDKWYKARGKDIQIQDLDLRQRQSHILEFAFANLNEDALRLLQQIAVFRYPIDYDILAAINPFFMRYYIALSPFSPERKAEYEVKQAEYEAASEKWQKAKSGSKTEIKWEQKRDELQEILNAFEAEQQQAEQQVRDLAHRRAEPDLDRALHLLEERGLVLSDVRNNLYDLHPVVRAYTYERLDPERRKEMLDGKKTVFESRAQTDIDQVTEIHHLNRELEIYHALLASELWSTAWEFYNYNIKSLLLFRLGVYYEIIELLQPLLDYVPPTPYLNALANALDHIDIPRARHIRSLSIKASIKDKQIENVSTELLNLCRSYTLSNQLYSSFWALSKVHKFLDYLSNTRVSDYYHRIAHDNVITGQWEQAKEAFLSVDRRFSDYWRALCTISYRKILMAQGGSEEAVLNEIEELAQPINNAYALRDLYQMRGDAALHYGHGVEAEQFFQQYENLCLKSRLSAKIALGGQARALLLQNKPDRARDLVENGIDTTSAAEVWLALGERDNAKAAAVEAYREAWGEGPPYARWWELQRATKVLETLNEPLPDMPPFDPANRERIPYEDELLAFIEELESKPPEEKKPDPFALREVPTKEDPATRGPEPIDFPRVSAPRPVGQRWALLVGANQYADPNLGPLNFCANDVQQIGQALERAHFSPLILNDQQSEKSRHPSSENVREALTRLQRTADPDDLLWLHFSCHGELVNGESALIFANTRQRTEPHILPIREIEDMFRNFKRVLVTLDACHVGVEGGRGADDAAFIRNVHEFAENFAVLAASTSQQRAAEWQDQRMGVFSYYLLNGIQGAADRSGRGFITVNDLAYHVLNGVRRWSWRQGGILQDPTYSIRGIGDMIVVDYRKGET